MSITPQAAASTPDDRRSNVETFPAINPPPLNHPKVDDRTPLIPRQRTASDLIASHRPFTSTEAGKELLDWAREMLDDPERDPAITADIRWVLALARDVEQVEDSQLHADLKEILGTPGPVGSLGDRVSEAVLRYTDRLMSADPRWNPVFRALCPDWCDDCLRDSGGTLHTGVVGTVTDKVNDAEPSTIVVRVERSDRDGKPGQAFVFLDAGSVELSPEGVANLGALLIEAAGIVKKDRAGAARQGTGQ
ncbi:hypothetical protein GA0070616_1362 [Micromonospora nigra]|uniref:Uncharacterized protein n=1 Tax=Micromonospora nigra TaxID=145857 RepID=A0A1C6RL57_9ACTN|nr:hypothetical protein [Micromonospora nigra]SCL17803.1 hypothetical protein GA0070616_1362 [Micromonospora nigra]